MADPTRQPLKPELFRLATESAREGVAALRAVIGSNPRLYIPARWDWREVEVGENGLPSFHENDKSSPPDYSALFGEGPNSEIDQDSLPSFRAFVDHLVGDGDYLDTERHRYRPDIPTADLLHLARLHANLIPAGLVEQFQTVFPAAGFDEGRFLPLYLRWEEKVFADHIPAEVVVPLLMVRAEFEECRLGPRVAVRRMGDALQRARAALLDNARNVHPWAAQAATHAVVIEGLGLSREQRRQLTGYPWEINDRDVYPMRQVDDAVAAVRVATGVVTGYAQVLIRYRYANSEHADHFPPDLHGVPVRRYPSYFDHWGWLDPVPVVTDRDAGLVADLFARLSRLPDTDTLAIAARRINDCYLRDRLDDAILDAVIAFETLLSDDDHHELTHKLALRVAALLKLEPEPPCPPQEAFREVKRIYQHRSKLVHGKAKEAAKDVQKYFGGDANGPLVAAVRYLRVVMRLLLQHERYRHPAEIDRRLLIGDAPACNQAETNDQE